MNLAQLAGAALLLVPTLAGAEAKPIYPSGSAQFGDIVGTKPNQDDLVFGRQVLPPQGPQHAVAQSRVIYLNKNGVTLLPGNNDSRTNRSTIASQQTQIPAWNVSATTWNATVACVREIFAPFDVQVVETDPGNVPHIEAVFGGSPTQLGMPNNVAGVSPFTTDCSIIENSIVFTFTNVIPADARLACEIQAQEIAHSFGLDHELLASDPMTYLDYNGNRSFKNQAASCGEDVQRPCGINGSVCRNNQNSVTLLNERLGINTGGGGTGNDPTLGINSPSNGATVPPGFQIQFDATNINRATLFVDGVEANSLTQAPFVFTTSATLSEGLHEFQIDATDGTTTKTQRIGVTIRKGALPPGNGNNDGGNASGDLSGGCSTGGNGAGLLFALGLVGLLRRRRR